VSPSIDPEREALLADSVGLALLVFLDRLTSAEGLAFARHDMFDVSFDEIGPIVGRTPNAARQLVSRAQRRVQGVGVTSDTERSQNRAVVDAFLEALCAGDFEGLIAVLDRNVLVHLDEVGTRPGAPREIRGALNWAKGAVAFSKFARFVQPALIDGHVGLVLAPGGRLSRALRFTITNGKISEVDAIADPARFDERDLAVVD
jgi:RNA polymerase sigma-70 factor (ECF subfamily)